MYNTVECTISRNPTPPTKNISVVFAPWRFRQ